MKTALVKGKHDTSIAFQVGRRNDDVVKVIKSNAGVNERAYIIHCLPTFLTSEEASFLAEVLSLAGYIAASVNDGQELVKIHQNLSQLEGASLEDMFSQLSVEKEQVNETESQQIH